MGKRQGKWPLYIISALLVLATVAVYWQVVGFDFTNFDDDVYVKNNPFIVDGLTPSGVQWSLTTTYQFTWVPLVWMSYMADHDIGSLLLGSDQAGADPRVCHTTNLILHVANVLLLFLLLNAMTHRPGASAFVAALFAIHPLHVESVAWVAERKDVLSTFFWLLTMLAYLRYVRCPSIRRYGLVVLAFALGLMSKPMLVALPVALLIIDYWPLGRLGTGEGRIRAVHAVQEKVPLFALAIASSIITSSAIFVQARSAGAVLTPGAGHPLGERLANMFVSYIAYIVKTLWPQNLAVFYPHPGHTLPKLWVLGAALAFVALCILALRAARTRPYVTAGWLWYVVTLVPVIGIVQVGKAALADRFTYVPLIGLFIVVAWGVPDLLQRLVGHTYARVLSAGLAAVSIAALMTCSYLQLGYWRNSYALFSHTIQVTGPNSLAQHNLGWALLDMGKQEEAIKHFRESLQINPDDPDVLQALGNILRDRSSSAELDEAIALLRRATRTIPSSVVARNSLGIALAKRGRLDEAISEFREALRLDPGLAEAQSNLDNALALKRQGP